MKAPSDSSPASATRRHLLGWSGVAGIATLAAYLGWNRSGPLPQAATTAVKPRNSPTNPAHAAEAEADAPPPAVIVNEFSREAFLPHLDTDFTLIHEGDTSAECRLVAVSPETRISSSKQTYTSFTILFAAEPTFLREGGICRVKHAKMGEMQIFLSPVGKPGATARLEAAFTQAV
jgi:hypothetical protein